MAISCVKNKKVQLLIYHILEIIHISLGCMICTIVVLMKYAKLRGKGVVLC